MITITAEQMNNLLKKPESYMRLEFGKAVINGEEQTVAWEGNIMQNDNAIVNQILAVLHRYGQGANTTAYQIRPMVWKARQTFLDSKANSIINGTAV